MQISWLKTSMMGDGEKIPESAKALAKWLHLRTERKENSDKEPLDGPPRKKEMDPKELKKIQEEKSKRFGNYYEALVTMVTVPTVVGVVIWTAAQLAGMFHTGGERVVQGRSAAFLSSPSAFQPGGLGRDSLHKDEMDLPGMLLVGSGRHLLHADASNYPKVARDVVDASLDYGRDIIGRSSRLEMNLKNAAVRVGEGSAEHGQLIASFPRKESLRKQMNGLLVSKASLYLTHSYCERLGLKGDKCAKFLATVDLGGTDLGKYCDWKNGGEVGVAISSQQTCAPDSPYRNADNSCNNLNNPSLGKAYTGYRRLLFPMYADGVQRIRRSVKGKPLPSARLVSTSLAPDADRPDQVTTLSLMQWTQFVEHDLAHTPSAMMLTTGTSIMCCRDNGYPLSPRFLHPSCAPVDIPSDDPIYSKHNQHCMNYVRSITTIRPGCTLGPSEQINQATHFLDASMIYGPDAETQRSIRTLNGGKMKTTEEEIETSLGKRRIEFFPQASRTYDFCQSVSADGNDCYHGADSRANEHPHLTVLHTLWLREHNRLADKLSEINPHWDDEKLFQEARRILIGQLQHITYSEWLPMVVGNDYYYKLFPEKGKLTSDYSKNVDPSTSNEFASAAIRFAHSMMEGNIRLYEENRDVNDTILLKDHYNQPVIVQKPGHFDSLVRGMATQNSQQMDLLFTTDVTSLLWRESKPFGMDIVSLDIQRGRDHGLQPYNKYRELCGLPLAKNFEDLTDVMPKQVVEKLSKLYAHVDDIDLYVGGMSESPIQEEIRNSNSVDESKDFKSSLVGPTFRCIIGEQMLRTKMADRYFYDRHPTEKSAFTSNQISQLKKASLARIFCDNGNDVVLMQRNVFQKPSINNPMSSCDDYSRIESLDLTQWKE